MLPFKILRTFKDKNMKSTFQGFCQFYKIEGLFKYLERQLTIFKIFKDFSMKREPWVKSKINGQMSKLYCHQPFEVKRQDYFLFQLKNIILPIFTKPQLRIICNKHFYELPVFSSSISSSAVWSVYMMSLAASYIGLTPCAGVGCGFAYLSRG